jgi:hypothetical protein
LHPERNLLRIGAVSSVVGLVLGIAAGAFHGGGGEPNNLQATLPHYAANNYWELVHFGQFVADILLLVAFIALYRSITEGVSATLARLGIIVAVVAEAIYGVNQAVDGVAIKFVAQQWVSAPLAEKAGAFRIAEAVRHIEIGTSSLWTLTSGIVLLLFGLAIALGRAYPRLLGWAAIGLGASEVAYSLNLARNGFAMSALAMATLLMAPWTLFLAFNLWRKAGG